jgi:hypothetical protein
MSRPRPVPPTADGCQRPNAEEAFVSEEDVCPTPAIRRSALPRLLRLRAATAVQLSAAIR